MPSVEMTKRRDSKSATADGKRKVVRNSDDEDAENSDPVSLKKPKASAKKTKTRRSKGSASSGEAGELVYSGVLDFKMAKGTDKIAWEFSRLSSLKGVPVSMVVSSSCSHHSIILTANGDVLAWGRGGQGQLGLEECPAQVYKPTLVKKLKKFRLTGAATGGSHTLTLTSDGDVYGFGSNRVGQLGIGNFDPVVSTPTRMLSKKIFAKISCGMDFSMVVDAKGYLYSCGNAESGRLGHGFPKEIIEGVTASTFENENRARRLQRYFLKDPNTKQSKDIDDVKIVDVQCGQHHTLALDDQLRVFTWGFGGHGRLGHGSANDEVFPRVVNAFLGENRKAKRIWAGASFSLALNELGSPLFWGHGREDVVTPQYVDSLRKKIVKSVAMSSNAVLVAADDELYTWSFGQTQGQMGLTSGQKSTSAGMQVPLPPDVGVISISCGHSFSLCLVGAKDALAADDQGSNVAAAAGKNTEKVLDAFPVVDLTELESKMGSQ